MKLEDLLPEGFKKLSPEEIENLRQNNPELLQKYLDNREKYLDSRRERYGNRSKEEIEKALAQQRQRRTKETPEEREERLANIKKIHTQYRDSETPEERERRLAGKKQKFAQKLSNETPAEREARLKKWRDWYEKLSPEKKSELAMKAAERNKNRGSIKKGKPIDPNSRLMNPLEDPTRAGLYEDNEVVRLPNGKLAHYTDKDAITFIYSKEFDVFLYAQSLSEGGTRGFHKHILATVVTARTHPFRVGVDKEKKTLTHQHQVIHYKGEYEDLMKFAEKFYKLYAHGAVGMFRNDQRIGIMGRYWKEQNVLSVWGEPKDVIGFVNDGSLEKIIRMAGLKPDATWIDVQNHVYPYKDLLKNMEQAKNMSREEWTQLMLKQHLDPVAKRKVAQAYADVQAKKASQGYDFPAQANWAKPYEGIIKLKDLLK